MCYATPKQHFKFNSSKKKNEKCVAYKKKRVNVFVILGKQYGVNGFSQFSQLRLILYLSAWMSKTSELHFFICYS